MHYHKGSSQQDLCHQSSSCGEKSCCHQCHADTAKDLSPCHHPGSLSRDLEGSSCQSHAQACQPLEPPQSFCPPQQSCSKPRRRVEVSHIQPICPQPTKVHRRPLQQYRPPAACQEQGSCCKPRRRVEQCPEEDDCPPPPIILPPPPLQHRHPCISSCLPPARRCCQPLPLLQPSQQQQKKVTLLPPCLQKI